MSTSYPYYVLRGPLFGQNVYPAFTDIGFITDPTLALSYPCSPKPRTRIIGSGLDAVSVQFKPVLRVLADVAPTPCGVCGGSRVAYETGPFWAEAEPCPSCATSNLTLQQQAI